jgi:hypothetical protein
MSRVDHNIERFKATMGDSWWWRRFADLVDRKQEDGTYKPFDYANATRGFVTKWRRLRGTLPKEPVRIVQPDATKPEMLPRPEGMTRQAHRRLYRETCKLAGVPWRAQRTFKVPRRERGRNWQDLSPEEAAKLEAQWAEFTKNSVRIE